MDISADVLPFLSKSFFTRIAEIANECVHFWWLCRCCCGQISGQFWINEIFQERFWICSIPCFQEKRWETKSIFSCFDTIQQSKGYLCRCARLLSLTAGLACCLSKNLPQPLHSTAEKPRWAFNPEPSWLLTLLINFVNIWRTQKYTIGQNDLVQLIVVINDHSDILLDLLQNETICLTQRVWQGRMESKRFHFAKTEPMKSTTVPYRCPP